ncbi:MAG: DUF6510 family protein [Kibdelosporangium sp.]
MRYVDGNAVAGIFAEALGIDISVVVMTCAGCGRSGRFAEQHVYQSAGAVARCPGCDGITARVVRTPTDVWLDLRGVRSVRVPLP